MSQPKHRAPSPSTEGKRTVTAYHEDTRLGYEIATLIATDPTFNRLTVTAEQNPYVGSTSYKATVTLRGRLQQGSSAESTVRSLREQLEGEFGLFWLKADIRYDRGGHETFHLTKSRKKRNA